MANGHKALAEYVATADTAVLQCRTGRHKLPYLDQWHITRPRELRGDLLAEGYCENGCGTYIRRIYSPAGYVVSTDESGSFSRYVYDMDRYPLPRAILADHSIGMAEVNAACRLELMKRGGTL
jgi:hypothetical protein